MGKEVMLQIQIVWFLEVIIIVLIREGLKMKIINLEILIFGIYIQLDFMSCEWVCFIQKYRNKER